MVGQYADNVLTLVQFQYLVLSSRDYTVSMRLEAEESPDTKSNLPFCRGRENAD